MRKAFATFGISTLLLLAGSSFAARHSRESYRSTLAELERRSQGRLGFAMLDTATGHWWTVRADQRFPMCSTFKASAAALVLHRVDSHLEKLDRQIAVSKEDILSYAPVTRDYAGKTMSVEQLCVAAITVSDNTAANLLLRSFGGPRALTNYWRTIGDRSSRLDRTEPTLNEAKPDDPRDTTTPRSMAATLAAVALGHRLSPISSKCLRTWLIANQTGANRLRAGLPTRWIVGDKTGTGDHGTSNDIAVIWPPNRAPVVVAVFLTGSAQQGTQRDEVVADVGRLAASILNRHGQR